MPNDAHPLAEDLRRTVSDFVRHVRMATGTTGSSRWETLELLERAGPQTVASLARLRGVKHQSMRLVVGELEAAGLVAREADAVDARAQRVTLQPLALQSLRAGREKRSAWIADRIERTLTAHERTQLGAALSLMHKLLADGT